MELRHHAILQIYDRATIRVRFGTHTIFQISMNRFIALEGICQHGFDIGNNFVNILC
jgi:hypothetical protein